MTSFGRYDPVNPAHGSSLFSYGEVPLESAKLNRWNGNLAATLDGVALTLTRLLGAAGGDFVAGEQTGLELLVGAQSPPDLTLRVLPGAAVIGGRPAGLTTMTTFPASGPLVPPSMQPRIDLVYLAITGELGVAQGAQAAEPLAPSAPADALALALIHWRVDAVAIKESDDGTQAYLEDIRPVRRVGLAHAHGVDPVPAEIPDGSRTAFTTGAPFVAGSLDVYLNGVLQRAGAHYDEDGDHLGYTFATAPLTGDAIQHRYVVAGA